MNPPFDGGLVSTGFFAQPCTQSHNVRPPGFLPQPVLKVMTPVPTHPGQRPDWQDALPGTFKKTLSDASFRPLTHLIAHAHTHALTLSPTHLRTPTRSLSIAVGPLPPFAVVRRIVAVVRRQRSTGLRCVPITRLADGPPAWPSRMARTVNATGSATSIVENGWTPGT